MHRKPLRLIIAVTATISIVLLGACGPSTMQGSQPRNDSHTVALDEQPWEDLIVEDQIVSQVLGAMGYQTRIDQLSVPLGAQALARGQADAYLGNWWPSQQPTFQSYINSGAVTVAGTMVTGTTYAPVVPDYVAQEYGIHSLADLAAHAGDFDHQILGIEPGSPGNQYILDAIHQNAYGLGDWQLVQSSTTAMLTEVQHRVDQHKPVVFLGWSPHWMNLQWRLVSLADPQHVWPGAGEIRVVTRRNLSTDNPNVARFLSQIKVATSTASSWIFQYDKNKTPAADIARTWIRGHHDDLAAWLNGVQSLDGTPAITAVQAKLGG